MLLILAASTLSSAAASARERLTDETETMSMEQTISRLRRLAEKSFTAALRPYAEPLSGVNLSVYGNVAAQRDTFAEMAKALEKSFGSYYNAAMGIVSNDLRSMGIPLIGITRDRVAVNWQEAASLYRAFGAETGACLADGLLLELTVSRAGAQFVCSFAENDVMFAVGTREQLLSARFTLSYLYTVYDDAGLRADYQTPELPAEYLAALIHPLPGCMIKDGWYDARSNRTRLHTGTDIRASRNTEILSMTDGVVLYVGFSRIPGYYVIIRDPCGYEYHYYHMVKQSEHVKEGEIVRRGQTVGLVGSTGNSVANHLHLAIVSPEGAYINPYDVFLQAGVEPIR